jgi:hypothetical protein
VTTVQPSHQAGRAERLALAVARQDGRCLWCGREFGPLVPATTDHLVPRVKGGPSWPENEVAACRRCNGQRGHTTPADWFAECERRGWHPDAGALRGALDALDAAVASRGGQRRARPYLAAQRRRLARMGPAEEPRGREGWQTRRP